jgi:hypothetical protein
MPTTYEPLATSTLGSAGTITFSSIPATYTDLRIVLVSKSVSSGANVQFRFNGDTATNYSFTYLRGNGTSASSYRETNKTFGYFSDQSSDTQPNLGTLDIFSYTGSTFKTVLATFADDRNGSGYVFNTVSLWRSTAAITSVSLSPSNFTDNFQSGTTATLYGIKNA